MAETSGPFDGVPWAEGQWYDFAPTWASSGVLGSPTGSTTTGELPLTVNGLTATLGTGRAWVRGAGYKNDAAKAFTVTANANSTLSRRDRIVLRRDLSVNSVVATRLAGTAAATPVAPALTQVDGGVWDFPLFSFLVPPNSGTTLTGFVDERTWTTTDADAQALTPATGWTTETDTGYGVPRGKLIGNRVDLSGMFRRSLINSVTANAAELYAFTDVIPAALRPSSQRLIGVGSTSAGYCEIYYVAGPVSNAPANTLAFSFRTNTTVYDVANWYLNLNSLHYYL